MKTMTTDLLKTAFAGESQAHMKYLAFAEQAEKEGKPRIANLFRAVAYAEQVHAFNHLRALARIGKTADNLMTAKEGEDFEALEMYPAYLAVAEMQEETHAQRSFGYALDAEKIHSELYAAAVSAVEAGSDCAAGKIWVCPICGWTTTEELPDRCPVCQALATAFKHFAV
ncbi:MAG: rubrerythrin family protein [Vicinamibacteria bacterium]|nr:rubrerythrin family protein [Vicinamibacteria bacterium]